MCCRLLRRWRPCRLLTPRRAHARESGVEAEPETETPVPLRHQEAISGAGPRTAPLLAESVKRASSIGGLTTTVSTVRT
jgi:hypothetical protein